ncbi:MAG: arginase family protein, partial [Candidatus Micropelagos thuwalensis]
MAEQHDKSMMDNLYWWGVPTLFRCPHGDVSEADIALVGVPHSTGNGTTERDQHLGPRAVRNISALQRRVHGEFHVDPWSNSKIIDAGDVPFPRANDNEHCIQQITDFYKKLDDKGIRPVSIGGDHSITGGIIQGLGKGRLSNGEKICFLHLDAHTDVFTTVDHFLGAKKSAAHWGAYLVDQELIDPNHSMQIGLRGHPRTFDWLKPSYDYGYNVVTMDEYRNRGAASVVEQIKKTIADRPVYITFDLDCLDPSVAPA